MSDERAIHHVMKAMPRAGADASAEMIIRMMMRRRENGAPPMPRRATPVTFEYAQMPQRVYYGVPPRFTPHAERALLMSADERKDIYGDMRRMPPSTMIRVCRYESAPRHDDERWRALIYFMMPMFVVAASLL